MNKFSVRNFERISTLILALFLLAGSARAYDSMQFLTPISLPRGHKPTAVAAGDSRLYVLSRHDSLLFVYDYSGQFLATVSKDKSGKPLFSSPRGLAVAPDGRVYVADTGNNRIAILDKDGAPLSFFGQKGSERGSFHTPRSVAVGTDGRVYVADMKNNRVEVFTSEGLFLYQFGGQGADDGQFRLPIQVAVDPADSVYVLDSGYHRVLGLIPNHSNRIEQFEPSTKFVQSIALPGNGFMFNPGRLFASNVFPPADNFAVDPYGFFYVVNWSQGQVLEENPSGSVSGALGKYGNGTGELYRPEGITVGPDGAIFIADTGNERVQSVSLTNHLKTIAVNPNSKSKIVVSGPTGQWPLVASALASDGTLLYAYLPSPGHIAVLDGAGEEKSNFGTKGKKQDQLRQAGGITVSSKYGIYVSDLKGDRIQKFDVKGAWQSNVGETTSFWSSKSKEGHVKSPRGVAVNDQGTLYVADAGNHRIDAFGPDGTFLFKIGPQLSTFQLQEPVSVVWNSQENAVFFLDRGLRKVFKCGPTGSFIAQWGDEGGSVGKFEVPESMASDGRRLYVLDRQNKRVSVFSPDGDWVTDIFAGGTDSDELADPLALTVNGKQLVIADAAKGKKGEIDAFDIHPLLAAPLQLAGTAKEGMVSLSWLATADPWTSSYKIYRSSKIAGPYDEVGKSEDPGYEDAPPVSATYYYRVATVAKGGAVGAPGAATSVAVEAEVNRPDVEITSATLGNVFSANYKWYLKNPLGAVVITNNVNTPFQSVKLSFRLKDFMDFSYDTEIKTLKRRESVTVPLIATLNNKILDVTEDTHIQAELSVTYFQGGKSQVFSITKPIWIYSRNAITWDNPSRIANFITPKDPPIVDFTRAALLGAPTDPRADVLNPNLVSVMHLWDALSADDVKFFAKPGNPYEAVSEDPNFPVDYTQFPRETLKRKSGQCDDLTTTIVSMLESAEIPAAVLDYPGHMALMFDTETDDPDEAGLPKEYLVHYSNSYWIPVEATLLGKSFPEAVRKAAYDYQALAAKGNARVIDVHEAWKSFEPATLPKADFELTIPSAEAAAKSFNAEVKTLFDEQQQFLRERLESRIAANPTDNESRLQLGLLEYQSGHAKAAAKAFNDVLAQDPKNAFALNNLGNVAFFAGDYAAAEARYHDAVAAESQDPDLWINLMRAELRLKNKDKARESGEKAVALDADLAPAVETLMKGS